MARGSLESPRISFDFDDTTPCPSLPLHTVQYITLQAKVGRNTVPSVDLSQAEIRFEGLHLQGRGLALSVMIKSRTRS
jgi:hypothetical protein